MKSSLVVFVGLLLGVIGAPRIDFGISDRIFNGIDAAEGEYPFMASLRQDGEGHICGTSIVNRFYTLTAAHCVSVDFGEYSVVVGTIYQSHGGTTYHVDYYKKHENFNYPDPENDIAVLKLSTPIIFSDVIQPAKLPAQNQVTPGGTPATVIGWGYQDEDHESAMEHLQKVDITVYSDEECHRIQDTIMYPTQVCAGVLPWGGKGVCFGDSGGPLVVNGEVIGIVSRLVFRCGGAPDFYTRVSHYINWILVNTIDPANQMLSS